jgi:thiamine biosynthesis protein ThiI
MQAEVLVRYGEIFLKSEFVRQKYEKKLVENIKTALKRQNFEFKIRRERGRIFVETGHVDLVCEALKKVFGIVSVSPCYRLDTAKLEEIKDFCKKNYERWIKPRQTFAVDARRIGKHSYTSKDIENAVGSVIGRRVDLENPDVTVGIEVRDGQTYIYTKIIPCLGGMPVSTSGKVAALLSGGIDSPVAAFLAMKRGCKVVFIHFHSFPLVSRASMDKVKELVKILNHYQYRSVLYLVPFHEIQMKIKAAVEAKYRIILYRRMMFRIAEELARKEGAKALVTGESLAQVSSQTLDNMATIEAAASIPVLRPLVGMDKEEIVSLAKKIGTYEISIRPQEDCCTLFVPKHPATKSKPALAEHLEKKLKLRQMVNKAIKNTEKAVFQF